MIYVESNDTHREKLVLLNSEQEFTRTEAWLLLAFFICLHNQLSSIHSVIRIKGQRCLKNVIHQIVKINGCCFQQVLQ